MKHDDHAGNADGNAQRFKDFSHGHTADKFFIVEHDQRQQDPVKDRLQNESDESLYPAVPDPVELFINR